MSLLQRASVNLGARPLWTRARVPRKRYGQRPHQSQYRNTTSKSEPPPQKPHDAPGPGNKSSRNATQKESNGTEPSKAEPVDIPIQLWYHRLGPVSTFFNWFHKTQLKRPYTVQLCTTLTTYFAGDLLAQDLGGERYDGSRTLRMLFIGAVAAIPGYKWFLFLGRNFNYASKALSIAVKVAVNQAVFTPVFNSYFFGMQAVLTGEGPHGVITRIKGTVPTSMVNSLKLWPAVTAFSFWFIQPQYRFMFSGIFAVAWQGYLSFLNRKEEKIEEKIDSLSHPVIPEGVIVK
ncbi:hypothetical protein PV10_02627 [Exophiala mesophila]|uniref:Protein SYM1 n=1 Tax=Exophiala mesophila TaxID=212818 RepID=A0A0D1Y2T8_EXOME|nr:uncharacterized protein PV10_02627 [Exophiala mesophila]KIV94906.1 hypothetical protein PV10_02627 [Exophiala mesophila]